MAASVPSVPNTLTGDAGTWARALKLFLDKQFGASPPPVIVEMPYAKFTVQSAAGLLTPYKGRSLIYLDDHPDGQCFTYWSTSAGAWQRFGTLGLI